MTTAKDIDIDEHIKALRDAKAGAELALKLIELLDHDYNMNEVTKVHIKAMLYDSEGVIFNDKANS